MGAFSVKGHLKSHDTPVAQVELQLRRLADNSKASGNGIVQETLHSQIVALLIGIEKEGQPLLRGGELCQQLDSMEHGGDASFHIGSASAVEKSTFHCGGKGREAPAG